MSRIFQLTVEILNSRTVLFNVKDGCLAEVTVDFAGRRIGRIVRITHQNFMDGPSGFPDGLPIPRRRRSRPLLGRNSVLLKAARSETSTLRPVESTGERASRAAVSTTRLAFENSRLECPWEGTVYTRYSGRAYLDGMEKARRRRHLLVPPPRLRSRACLSHASHRNNWDASIAMKKKMIFQIGPS